MRPLPRRTRTFRTFSSTYARASGRGSPLFFFARKSCVVLGRCRSNLSSPSRGWGEVLGVLLPQPPPGAHLRAGRRASHRVSTHGRVVLGFFALITQHCVFFFFLCALACVAWETRNPNRLSPLPPPHALLVGQHRC